MPGSRLTHVVRSDAFSGVERYLTDVAGPLIALGWQVTVVGGDPAQMERRLPGSVVHHAAVTTKDAGRVLRSLGRCDLVHTHMTAAEVAALVTLPWHQARLVTTRHFSGARGSHPAARVALRVAARAFATELAISQFVASQLPERTEVLLNGVATPPVSARERERTVLLAQRLEPEKQTELGLGAWERSGLAAEGWQLLVAGRGSQGAALEAAAPAGVTFLGFVDLDEVRATSSIFLATAPAEPFGLSVVEAMAAGMAVVVADGGAHRETVGDAGVLVPPGNAQEMGMALRALADDEPRRSALGQAARARQQALFTLERHVERLDAIYRRVLSRR